MATTKARAQVPFYFSSSGSNDEGKIEIVSNNVEISSNFNGGLMKLFAKTIGGTLKELIALQPDITDGAVYFVESNVYIQRNAGSSFFNNSAGGFSIRNLSSGNNLILSARNVSAVDKILIDANPDTETASFLAIATGIKIITSDTDSLDVKGIGLVLANTTNNNITIGGLANGAEGQIVRIVKQNSPNNLILEHNELSGTQKLILNGAIDATIPSYGGTTFQIASDFCFEANH